MGHLCAFSSSSINSKILTFFYYAHDSDPTHMRHNNIRHFRCFLTGQNFKTEASSELSIGKFLISLPHKLSSRNLDLTMIWLLFVPKSPSWFLIWLRLWTSSACLWMTAWRSCFVAALGLAICGCPVGAGLGEAVAKCAGFSFCGSMSIAVEACRSCWNTSCKLF